MNKRWGDERSCWKKIIRLPNGKTKKKEKKRASKLTMLMADGIVSLDIFFFPHFICIVFSSISADAAQNNDLEHPHGDTD